MSEEKTVTVRKADLDILVAGVTSWAPGHLATEATEAFTRLLNAWDDAGQPAAPEPAKVIVVTETGFGERVIEKRFAGAYEPGDFGLLVIRRDGREVARYQQHAWHSVHEDGALVPDGAARKLGIAMAALREIEDEPHVGFSPERARKALEDIADVDL